MRRLRARRLLVLVALLLLGTLATRADSQTVSHQGSPTLATRAWSVAPTQGSTLLNNNRTTSAANTAATITITGTANFRVCLRLLTIFSSAAGAATVTVQDGATIDLDFGTVTTGVQFTNLPLPAQGFCASTGNNLVVNIGAAGAAVTTTTSALADRS